MKCRQKLGFQKEELGSGQGQSSCCLEAGAQGAKASSQERRGSWPERPTASGTLFSPRRAQNVYLSRSSEWAWLRRLLENSLSRRSQDPAQVQRACCWTSHKRPDMFVFRTKAFSATECWFLLLCFSLFGTWRVLVFFFPSCLPCFMSS